MLLQQLDAVTRQHGNEVQRALLSPAERIQRAARRSEVAHPLRLASRHAGQKPALETIDAMLKRSDRAQHDRIQSQLARLGAEAAIECRDIGAQRGEAGGRSRVHRLTRETALCSVRQSQVIGLEPQPLQHGLHVGLQQHTRPSRHRERRRSPHRRGDGAHLGEVGELAGPRPVRHRRQDRVLDDRTEKHVRRERPAVGGALLQGEASLARALTGEDQREARHVLDLSLEAGRPKLVAALLQRALDGRRRAQGVAKHRQAGLQHGGVRGVEHGDAERRQKCPKEVPPNLLGACSLAIVVVPSPQDANASCVASSKAQPSTPVPIGTLPTTFPLLVSSITIILLWQPENKR